MNIIAEAARGTGRLEGHICDVAHEFLPATPGRADARWVNTEAGCVHLAIDVAVFATLEDAERAVERDALTLSHEGRAASHAALEESDGLYPDEMIALPSGRGFVMWDGTGAIRALPGHYARYQGITTRTSSCEHTRPFSYRVCRECAAEFVRRATDS